MQKGSSRPIFLSLLNLLLLFDYYTFLHYGGHNTRHFFFTLRPRDTVTASTKKKKNWERECRFYILLFALSFSRWLRTFHKKRLSDTRLVPFFFFFFFLCLFWSFSPFLLLHRWRRKSQVKPSMDVSRMGWFKLHSYLNYFTSCHLGFTDMLIAINQVASLFPFFYDCGDLSSTPMLDLWSFAFHAQWLDLNLFSLLLCYSLCRI